MEILVVDAIERETDEGLGGGITYMIQEGLCERILSRFREQSQHDLAAGCSRSEPQPLSPSPAARSRCEGERRQRPHRRRVKGHTSVGRGDVEVCDAPLNGAHLRRYEQRVLLQRPE